MMAAFYRRSAGVLQIVLLISFAFAISFLMSEYVGVGSAQEPATTIKSLTGAYGSEGVKVITDGSVNIGSLPTETEFVSVFQKGNTAYGLTGSGSSYALTKGADGVFTASGTATQLPGEFAAQLGKVGGVDVSTLTKQGWNLGQTAADGSQYIFHPSNPNTGLLVKDGSVVGQAAIKDGALVSGGNTIPTTGGYQGNFFGLPLGSGGIGYLLEGAVWAAVVYGGIQLLGSALGLEEGLTDALSLGASSGVMAYSVWSSLGPRGFDLLTASQAAWAPWIGIGVGAAVFILTYEEQKTEIVQFQCLPWEAPYGGNRCEECNDDPSKPCSEYRCKSLGQACELQNEGTEEELCVWVSRDDVSAPVIRPSEDALTNGLNYRSDGANGFVIEDRENPRGCIDPYSLFEFGIEADEPAKCRVSLDRTESFEDMTSAFGNSQLFRYEHTQRIPVANPFEDFGEEFGEVVHNNGRYTLYVRCVDSNGNGQDSRELGFNFCVRDGPDNRPPEIREFSLEDGAPIRAGAGETPIIAYTNEPAVCKWSWDDKDYDAMENTMICAGGNVQFNADFSYPCSSTLTQIIDRQTSDFFFRCEDRSGNKNLQSEVLTLRGTEELTIQTVGPTGTVLGSTASVPVNLTVVTANGADEGVAVCSYSETNEEGSFIPMENTADFRHSQVVPFDPGTYTIYYSCTDGANTVTANTMFEVDADTQPPRVTRVYRDGASIKIVTDEEARCVYSEQNCEANFEDAVPMSWDGSNRQVHITEWNSDTTYHIKCRDMRGREPSPNACQIIIRGSEF